MLPPTEDAELAPGDAGGSGGREPEYIALKETKHGKLNIRDFKDVRSTYTIVHEKRKIEKERTTLFKRQRVLRLRKLIRDTIFTSNIS